MRDSDTGPENLPEQTETPVVGAYPEKNVAPARPVDRNQKNMSKQDDIQLLHINYLRGPNIWTYRPVLEVWMDLGTLEDFPSNLLPGFSDRLVALLPALLEHHCGVGERGGFIQRLYEGTWAGHVLEHVVIELLNLAGMPTGFGQTRSTSKRGIYRMVVRAQVSEADVARLKIGMPVNFTTLGRPDRHMEARLDAIESTPELVNGAIFYDAAFEVANPDHSLLPQMTAQVFFVLAEAKNALVVPLAALASIQRQSGARIPGCPSAPPSEDSDCVRVLVDGQPVARPVTVGVKNEGNAQILGGIEAGDQVIVGLAGAPAGNGSGKGNAGGKGGGNGGR